MNRIITINIGGIAIQIEEDAYEVLRKYLSKIKTHFANTDNGSEIIEDIEARIAEMLHEKLNDKPSINVQDIEEVIEVMGNPTDFEADLDEDEYTQEHRYSKSKRSLYRDPERGILGGVCSGLAYYLNVEVVFIRIIWIILFFVFGTGFFFYLILWFIIPKAETTADRIKMMGETPNIENIKNTIRDEANQAYQNIKDSGFSDKIKDGVRKINEIFFGFLGGIGKTIFAFLSVLFFIVFLAVVAHLILGQSLFNIDVPWLNREKLGQVYNHGFMFWVTLTSFYLLILVPLAKIFIGLLQLALRAGKRQERPHSMRTGLRYLFFFALITLVLSSVYTYSLFANTEMENKQEVLAPSSDTLYLSRTVDSDNDAMEIDRNIKLYIHYNPKNQVMMESEMASKGRNEEEASELLSDILPGFELNGSSMNFHRKVRLKESSSYREQEIRYDLYLPKGTILHLGPKMYPILRSAKNVDGLPAYKMSGHSFLMTAEGLKCKDCKSSEKSFGRSNISEEFSKISINEWVKVAIVYGSENSVHMEGDKDELEEISAKVEDGKLKIYSHENDYVWERLREDVEIVITCSELTYLESNGASEISLEGFKNLDRLKIELNGASELRTDNIKANSLDVEVNGAAKVNLKGSTQLLTLETNGASNINAYKMDADEVDLDIAGAASCFVRADKQIRGTAAGVSKIRYKGDANISVDVDGFASVKRSK